MCDLNYSCSAVPRHTPPLDIHLTNLSEITVETLNILNQNDTIQSFQQLANFIEILSNADKTKIKQEDETLNIIENLNLTNLVYTNTELMDFMESMKYNLNRNTQLYKESSIFNNFYNTILNNLILIIDTYKSIQILQNVTFSSLN